MILPVRVNHLLVFSKPAVGLNGLISGRFSHFSSSFNSDQLVGLVSPELPLYFRSTENYCKHAQSDFVRLSELDL